MATFYLANTILVGTNKRFPGDLVNDQLENAALLRSLGASLVPSSVSGVAAAAAQAIALRLRGGSEADCALLMSAFVGQQGISGGVGSSFGSVTTVAAGGTAALSASTRQSVEVDGSGAQAQVTFPAAPADGDAIYFKATNSSSAPVKITPGSGAHQIEKPDGSGLEVAGADVFLAEQFGAVTFVFRAGGPCWRAY